jgi:predicted site-specific integrase-resolvase
MQKGIAQEMGFLTEDEVAELFSVAKPTLENWRRHGTGPAYAHAGNRFFYPVSGVSTFLMSRVKGFGFGQGVGA